MTDGLCDLCEGRPGHQECRRCETVACRMHFDGEMGLCADCAARAKSKPDERRGDTFQL